jgi:2'-5' RNA ligase
MRLFTAIDLPPEILERLDALMQKLRPLAPIAWSPLSNLHITVKFIGKWPDARLPQLERALSLSSRAPVPIRIVGLGFFPDRKRPHTFWAGVQASRQLVQLAEDTNLALMNLVDPEILPYTPHLTLARIRGATGLGPFEKEVARSGQPEFGSFIADRFYLYRSKPGPSGSVYTKLSEFPFTTT